MLNFLFLIYIRKINKNISNHQQFSGIILIF
nr:MAG TPA: hypothetical protein [Caudoviricetes sp.]